MARKKQVINLLKKEEFSNSTAGRVLTWFITSFRIIVIITMLLIMLAFLSRFWLDARNTDLSEMIKQKQAVLAAAAPFEQEYKDLQARLALFTEFTKDEGITSEVLGVVTTRLPPDVSLKSFSVVENGLSIEGAAASETSIQQFIVNLDASGSFSDVSLEEIETDEDQQLLSFRISAKFSE